MNEALSARIITNRRDVDAVDMDQDLLTDPPVDEHFGVNSKLPNDFQGYYELQALVTFKAGR